MQDILTYGKISSITETHTEDKDERKIKIDAKWELDCHELEISLVIKGKDYAFPEGLNSPDIGQEFKIIIKDGPQASLEQFQEEEEDHIKPCGCDMDMECEDCTPTLQKPKGVG